MTNNTGAPDGPWITLPAVRPTPPAALLEPPPPSSPVAIFGQARAAELEAAAFLDSLASPGGAPPAPPAVPAPGAVRIPPEAYILDARKHRHPPAVMMHEIDSNKPGWYAWAGSPHGTPAWDDGNGDITALIRFVGHGCSPLPCIQPPSPADLAEVVRPTLADAPGWKEWQRLRRLEVVTVDDIRHHEAALTEVQAARREAIAGEDALAELSRLGEQEADVSRRLDAAHRSLADIRSGMVKPTQEAGRELYEAMRVVWDARAQPRSREAVLLDIARACGALLAELAGLPLPGDVEKMPFDAVRELLVG